MRSGVFEQPFTFIEKGFRVVERRFTFVERLFTLVEKGLPLVERSFTFVEKQFAVVERRFTFMERLFTLVDRSFTFVERLFAVVERSVTLVEWLFTVVEQLFTLIERSFTSVETRFPIVEMYLPLGIACLAYKLVLDCSAILKIGVTYHQNLGGLFANLTIHALVPKHGDEQIVNILSSIKSIREFDWQLRLVGALRIPAGMIPSIFISEFIATRFSR